MGVFGFPYSWIFLPQYFLLVFLLWILMGTLSVNSFQSNLFYIRYDIRLRFYEPFFSMWSSVYVLCWFFFSTRCQYYMNYWTHTPFNCWSKIDPTSEYVEMVNKYTLLITLGYIVLWNVIRRIYLTVRNTFDEPWQGPPPPFF